jgi:hypothetical protein
MTGVPATVTLPALERCRPARIFNNVVLPQPLGPTIVTNSRSPTDNEISLSA